MCMASFRPPLTTTPWPLLMKVAESRRNDRDLRQKSWRGRGRSLRISRRCWLAFATGGVGLLLCGVVVPDVCAFEQVRAGNWEWFLARCFGCSDDEDGDEQRYDHHSCCVRKCHLVAVHTRQCKCLASGHILCCGSACYHSQDGQTKGATQLLRGVEQSSRQSRFIVGYTCGRGP